MFDERPQQAVECGAYGMKKNASNILHYSVGCGAFSGWLFRAGKIVGSYYGPLAYTNLTTQKQFQKPYDDCIISVTREAFSIWAYTFPKPFFDFTGKGKSAGIVPALSCCMQFINDIRYLSVDKATEIQLNTQPRENNVSFVLMSPPDTRPN